MFINVFCVYVFILSMLQKGQAFWWSPATTKAPETILRQIPLTYFRTYTYQPLAGNSLSFPFFGGGASSFAAPSYAAQPPLLTGARYDAYAGRYAPGSVAVHTTAKTTSTTTTTRPTTTPPPTTTKRASTTSKSMEITPPRVAGTPQYGNDQPTFNRRIFSSALSQQNFYRPSYPYPEYSNMKLGAISRGSSSHIQFVPCMCPISVGLAAGLDEKAGMDTLLAEQRNTSDSDSDMELPVVQDGAKMTNESDDSTSLDPSQSKEALLLNKIDFERIDDLRGAQLMNSEDV